MSSPTTTTVLIIGAGVGGLILAQGLRKAGMPFLVFERDALLDSRLQGYRLKITGDVAAQLRQTLPAEVWSLLQRTCAQAVLGETNLNATDAAVRACRRGRLPAGVPLPLVADRGVLRKVLMSGIDDRVRFGQTFVAYEELLGDDGSSRIRAQFADGSAAEGVLLVAADGVGSRVRRQLLPQVQPVDTGVRCIYGKSPLGEELRAQYPERHRRWITVVRDETPLLQSIITGRDSPVVMVCEPCHFSPGDRDRHPDLIPDDYVHWGILFSAGLGVPDPDLWDDGAAAVALDITGEWDPSIRSLIELQDRELTHGMRVLSAPAALPEWEPSDRVTVLGDAVHVMSPSGGVGAVAAIHDACLLSGILAQEGHSKVSIGKYERGMREFAKKCIGRSNEAAGRMLG
ncbi:O-methyltransferase aurJ [Apiospora sp. TS-2023a]